MNRREREEYMDRAVERQVKIIALENLTGAKTHTILEALNESEWNIDKALEIVRR